MKQLMNWILILIALSFPALAAAADERTLTDPEKVQGIDFPAGTVLLMEAGKLKIAQPGDNVRISNVTYLAAKPVWFYPSGAVSNGVLAEDQMVDGVMRSGGKQINFLPDGRVKYAAYPNSMQLATNTVLMGIDFPGYSRLSFDGDKNKVTFAWLADTAKIEGISVWGGTSNYFVNGIWQRPQLASNTNFIVIETNTINGITFYPGTIIGFEGTNVKIAYIGDNTLAGGVLWPGGTWLRFSKDMKVQPMSPYMLLPENATLQELPLVSNAMVYWYVKENALGGGILSRPATVQGIALPAGTELRFTADKKLQSFMLYAPGVIRNVKFPAYAEFFTGETGLLRYPDETAPVDNARVGQFFFKGNTPLQFFRNGKPKMGFLGMQAKVRGMNLRANTQLFFTPAGDLLPQASLTLADDSWIQRVKFKGGESVEFYKNGKVKGGMLARDLDISGIRFRANYDAQLFEDGGIKSGTLGQDYTNGGIQYEADRKITFHGAGKIAIATLLADTPIGGVKYQGDSEVEYNPAGKLVRGALLEDTTVGPIKYAKAREIVYDDAGAVKNGTLAADTAVQGVPLKAGTAIYFGKTGKLQSVFLKGNTPIGGLVFLNGTEIRFHDNGSVSNGTLAEEKQIGPLLVPANGPLQLYANGNVLAASLGASAVVGAFTYKPLFDYKTNIAGTNTNVQNLPKISIYFSEKGKVTEGVLDGAQNVGGFPLRGPISFDNNGNIKAITLSEDFTISSLPQALTFKANSSLVFYPNGSVSNGSLAGPVTLDANSKLVQRNAENYNFTLKKGSDVVLYPSGYLKSATLQSMSVDNPSADPGIFQLGKQVLQVRKGSKINFFESGYVQTFTLDADMNIQGVECQKFDTIELSETGKLVKRSGD